MLGKPQERRRQLHIITSYTLHVHAALGGDIEQSPEEITLAFLNNLAYLLGRNRFWRDGYYVGTFSEYDMCIVRQLAKEDPNHWWR